MDLNLSKYTGEDILREIRAANILRAFRFVPGVLRRPSGTSRCFWSLGVARFITKPSGLSQFMEIGKIIKDLLEDARAGSAVMAVTRAAQHCSDS